MKTCTICKAPKPQDEFYKRGNGKYYTECKACNNTKKNKWTAKNRPKRFKTKQRNWLKQKYGITPDELIAILATQGNKCAICRSPTPRRKTNWIVDHCHKTGRTRGLLCHHCNLALGHVNDSIAILRAMVVYLQAYGD